MSSSYDMKHILSTFFLVLLSVNIHAGDNPCVAQMLNINDSSFSSFNNNITTNSTVPPPPYGGYQGPDTWLSFVMPASGLYLLLNEITMVNPAIAIYSGQCDEPKLLYNVLDNNCNGEPNPLLFIDKLTPGEQYYIRVWAENGSANGVFEIKLVETLSVIPDFIAFADANIVGECIELTQNQGEQQGCAWYQNAIDFNFPFVHEMAANFGTKDASGADGICLVYQSNGQNFCGGTGEGIGAGGMANSAIFEFDTWRNTNLNDPFQDHCAFNINGNMNHNTSIEGPVSIGNIEDGLDHTILFEWNPVGNLYTVIFDGAVVLSGSYDIINNCFGGSNMAFWGYTSSTGGASNLHSICPEINIYEPSSIDYNEVDICVGDTYMGHSTSGFYVDFSLGLDGCQYQTNTLLTVHEIPDPEYINDVVCEGEFVLVADSTYTLPNIYEIKTLSKYGCDSVIFLELKNIIIDISLGVPDLITCKNTLVEIFGFANSNFPNSDIDYFWNSNGEIYNQSSLVVNESGSYDLSCHVTVDGKQCVFDTFVVVDIDTISPQFQNLEDIYLDCSNINSDTTFTASGISIDMSTSWEFNNNIVSNQSEVIISNEGTYSLIITDNINGCKSIDSFDVVISIEDPIIELTAEKYNCKSKSFNLNFSTSGSIDTFLWMYDDQFFSYDSLPNIVEAGSYSVSVINDLGCEATAMIELEIDTLQPTIQLEDIVVPCDSITTSLTVVSGLEISWNGPNDLFESTSEIIITEQGWYYLTVSNPVNFCESTDSSYVQFLGESPVLSIESDSISCFNPEASISVNANQTNLSYNWTSQNEYNSETKDIEVNQEGWYIVNASSENGCNSIDSIFVSSNLTVPIIDLVFDTIDCVSNSAYIISQIIDGGSTKWTGPNLFSSTFDSIIVSDPGVYFITVINAETGCEISDSANIIDVSIHPEFVIGADTLDCVSDNLSVPFSVLTMYNSILWTGPNGFSSDLENPVVSEPGEYKVHLEFDDNCLLDTSLFITEDIEPPFFSVLYDSITCFDPYVTFQFELESEHDNLILTTPSGNTTSKLDFQSDEDGEYYFLLTGDNGCEIKDTFLISQYTAQPDVMIGEVDTITCIKPNIIIEALSSESNLFYNWTGINGFSNTNSQITVSQGGDYYVTITNQYGCTNEVSVLVPELINLPLVLLDGEDLTCDALEVSLVLTLDDNVSQIIWQGDESFTEYSDSIIVESSGWYSVEAINEYECSSKDSFFVKSFTDLPTLDLVSEDTLVLNSDNPNGQIVIEADSYETINWLPNIGLSCNDCLDPIITSTEITEYIVTIKNEFGCSASEIVYVRYQEDLRVYIPNIFSPSNGDGTNDLFTLYGNENIAIINSMKIYDRWGSLVAEKENFEPNNPTVGWDGVISGQFAVTGVYAFVFIITDKEGNVYNFYGDLTLL